MDVLFEAAVDPLVVEADELKLFEVSVISAGLSGMVARMRPSRAQAWLRRQLSSAMRSQLAFQRVSGLSDSIISSQKRWWASPSSGFMITTWPVRPCGLR